MLQYPSIYGSVDAPIGQHCIAFEKYDGSNLRWEWSPKRGWHKFGTRRQLFNQTDPLFGQAIPLFLDSRLGDKIVEKAINRKANKKNKIERITAFTEFLGPNSFAGKHDEQEPKELKLIDVFEFKKGFLNPTEFVELFNDLKEFPTVIYDGILKKSFIDDVRCGKYIINEGVVAKCTQKPYTMVKIKTSDYFERLNKVYGFNYRTYWE